jgi:hypothetical protein
MTDSARIVATRVEAILKSRFSEIGREDSEKIIDAIMKFYLGLEGKRLKRSALLQQVTEILQRVFGFGDVSVLTKGTDDLFRYEIVIGLDKEPEKELRSLVFTKDQICQPDATPAVKINKYIDMTVAEAEQRPEQRVGFAHPKLISMSRKNFEDFTYGDYLDVYIYGKDNQHVAVFELATPRDGELPSANKLKGLTLFALIIGNIMEYQIE